MPRHSIDASPFALPGPGGNPLFLNHSSLEKNAFLPGAFLICKIIHFVGSVESIDLVNESRVNERLSSGRKFGFKGKTKATVHFIH